MRKMIYLGLIIFSIGHLKAQSTDAGSTGNFWGANKFLGWNASNGTNPLLIKNNNVNRMKLNGNLNYAVDGYNTLRDGYLLLGIENNLMDGSGNIYTQSGAFSLLHLNGRGTEVQPYGYRPWMETGITFTGNRDLSYIGLRQVGIESDITETTIAWSDNQNAPHPGPDDMVFRFLGRGGGATAISSNLESTADLNSSTILVIQSEAKNLLSSSPKPS